MRHVPGKLFEQRLQHGVRGLVGHAGPQAEIDDTHRPRILRKFQRQVDICAVPGEPRRGNPDDHVVFPVQFERLSQHLWT